MLRSCVLILGLGCASIAHAVSPSGGKLEDPYFGEALYYAHQGKYFDAIARLDTELGMYYGLDEPKLDSLYHHIDSAEFFVGDFELSYRMHQRAGRAIKAVLEGNVAEPVRNEAAYRLARIYFQKDQPVNALHALERIEGEIPERIQDDVEFLRAHVHMRTGRFSDAIDTLEDLRGAQELEGFVDYNLGVALYGAGREEEAVAQLAKAGEIGADNKGATAIADKANLVLGTRLLREKKAAPAKKYLDRVRLEGPFSNRALLSAGWAAASQNQFRRALVPWTMLVKRNPTQKPVQEALLAVPYAYGKIEFHGKAALAYGRALEAFGTELDKLDASIKSIRSGKFLQALVREEVKKDKYWVVKLRELPQTPETYYLTDLMASHDFQSSLRNYLDLEDLRKRLTASEGSLDAWQEIIDRRRKYYEPLLPEIDKNFRRLDARIKLRTEQRDHLAKRLKDMLIAPRPDFLATKEERIIRARIQRLEKRLGGSSSAAAERMRQRLARMKGVITWRLETEYDQRLTEAHEHLSDLDGVIERLRKQYRSFVRTRQAATQSYQGYKTTIRQLRARRDRAKQRVKTLMARQGHMLEQMAVAELEKRRARLEKYQVKARFAMADSYDRATKAQQKAKAKAILEKSKAESAEQATPESAEPEAGQGPETGQGPEAPESPQAGGGETTGGGQPEAKAESGEQ